MVDTIKISSNPEKVTTPGIKNVYRIINKLTNKAEGDYVTLSHERPADEARLRMFHPVHTHISKFVTNFEARNLHVPVFENGDLVYESPTLTAIQSFAKENLTLLWDEYKRTMMPEVYPVDFSQACWDNKMKNISKEQIKVNELVSTRLKGG